MSAIRRAITACAAVALALLAGCVSMETPRVGEAVALHPDYALVAGRVRMLNAGNENIEYSAFRFDPWDQPFFAPGPRMTLELRQRLAPGGAVEYRTRLAPPMANDGFFFWILPAGDYVLLGNPRLPGSERFTAAETETLARFAVPAPGETVYLGTLIIAVDFGLEDVVAGWNKDEAEYAIRGRRVVDEGERNLARLRERFPAFPEPVVTRLMRVE